MRTVFIGETKKKNYKKSQKSGKKTLSRVVELCNSRQISGLLQEKLTQNKYMGKKRYYGMDIYVLEKNK
jgi:hypothetical protein